MIYYIRNIVQEVLYAAYPEQEKKYGKYLVKLSYKEVKKNSQYHFESRTITVNNLSHTPGDLFISILLSLAEHIDIINRHETHFDREYFMIAKKLLQVSLERNIIDIKDLKVFSDEKMRNKLQENFSSFSNWKYDLKIDQGAFSYIYVYESFMIKNILKTSGYKYDSDQGLWIKKVATTSLLDEEEFFQKYRDKAIFSVISNNRFFIRPVYLLKLKTYSRKDAPLLKAYEYQYKVKQNLWVKMIEASVLRQEQENVKDIPKQFLKISGNT